MIHRIRDIDDISLRIKQIDPVDVIKVISPLENAFFCFSAPIFN